MIMIKSVADNDYDSIEHHEARTTILLTANCGSCPWSTDHYMYYLDAAFCAKWHYVDVALKLIGC